MNIKKPFPQESAGCWGIMGNPDDISQKYPMKGYMIKARWSEVEVKQSVYDWTEMDEKIRAAIDANEKLDCKEEFEYLPKPKVGLALNIGPDSPQWIYNTVPKLITGKYHSSSMMNKVIVLRLSILLNLAMLPQEALNVEATKKEESGKLQNFLWMISLRTALLLKKHRFN